MTTFGPAPQPAAQALARGSRPRIADFEAAMAEARRRRRRRGLQSAGAGVALAALVGVAGLHGALTAPAFGRDDVHLVDTPDSPEHSDRVHRGLDALDVQVAAPGRPAERPAVTRREPAPLDADEAAPDDGDRTTRRVPARVARTNGPGLLPAYCTASASWCQTAGVHGTGKNAYALTAVLCLKAGTALGSLDYRTAQEVDFELLSGSRVIWRWSDGQTFAIAPHRLSALAGECYTWQTVWDRHDSRGHRVGKARLVLRVRNTAEQAAHPAAATTVFVTS